MKLKDLPIGSIVKYPDFRYLGATIEWLVVAQNHHLKDSGYPKDATTLHTKDIITNKAIDNREPLNIIEERRTGGNNNYFLSNISQWLNSNKNNWYVPQHNYDSPPETRYNSYYKENGFLVNAPDVFRQAILPTTISNDLSEIDREGTKKERLHVFLPSEIEVGFRGGGGEKWDFYNSSNSRKKTRTPQTIAHSELSDDNWFTRSPYLYNGSYLYAIHADGDVSVRASAVTDFYGITPALNISNHHDVTLNSDGTYNLIINHPPNKSTNLQPNGVTLSYQRPTVLSWQFNDLNINDRQSKAEIRYRVQGSADWENVVVTGDETQYTIPTDTFNGGKVEWQVKTYDLYNESSPWSDLAVFNTAATPQTPVITLPDDVVTLSKVTVEWTAVNQNGYQIILKDILDTGMVTSNSQSVTLPIDLQNHIQHNVSVRYRDTSGVWSDWVDKDFTVDYEEPMVPSVRLYNDNYFIKVIVSNPIKDNPIKPDVIRNDIEKYIDDEWVKVAEVSENGIFNDYHVAFNKEYNYRVIAHGENKTITTSNLVTGKLARGSTGTLFFDVNNPSVNHPFEVIFNTRQKKIRRESTERIYYGRSRPVYESSPMTFESLSFTVNLKDDERGKVLLEDWIVNNTLLGYKDDRGRLLYTVLPNLSIDDIYLGYNVDITITAYDYKEGL